MIGYRKPVEAVNDDGPNPIAADETVFRSNGQQLWLSAATNRKSKEILRLRQHLDPIISLIEVFLRHLR